MNFNSLEYLLFLPVTLALYFLAPVKVKNPLLLAASFFFYACWEPAYALLMLFSTAVTYLSGLWLEKIKHSSAQEQVKIRRKKWVVAPISDAMPLTLCR